MCECVEHDVEWECLVRRPPPQLLLLAATEAGVEACYVCVGYSMCVKACACMSVCVYECLQPTLQPTLHKYTTTRNHKTLLHAYMTLNSTNLNSP